MAVGHLGRVDHGDVAALRLEEVHHAVAGLDASAEGHLAHLVPAVVVVDAVHPVRVLGAATGHLLGRGLGGSGRRSGGRHLGRRSRCSGRRRHRLGGGLSGPGRGRFSRTARSAGGKKQGKAQGNPHGSRDALLHAENYGRQGAGVKGSPGQHTKERELRPRAHSLGPPRQCLPCPTWTARPPCLSSSCRTPPRPTKCTMPSRPTCSASGISSSARR